MELGDSCCLENLSDCNSGAFKDMGNGYISFVVTRQYGDEFCIFLFGYRRKEEIVDLLNSFWRTLEENPMEIQENSYKTIRISGGFSIITQADTSVKELFHQADEALYEVKNANKGYFVEYHS